MGLSGTPMRELLETTLDILVTYQKKEKKAFGTLESKLCDHNIFVNLV